MFHLRSGYVQAASTQTIIEYLAREKGLDARTVKSLRVLRRSIDARQRTIYVNLSVRAYINEMPTDDEYVHTEYPDVSGKPRVIVVGAGPGGLFAALRLIELGLCPIVIERGKNVHDRKKDMAAISKTHKVDADSNYCFGEGGAGAFSDGKLYTRSKKRGNISKILNVFCQHGAPTSILSDSHPHIGTDKLPRVIENMRNTILKSGGEVHFQMRMERLMIHENHVVGIEAVSLETGEQCHFNHRNHPSLVMWSIGNEIPEQWSEEGVKISRHLQDICHQLDPSRPVTQGMDRAESALKSGFAQVMDIPGFNYRVHKYDNNIKQLPIGFLLGSETASTISSRGVYKFPVKISNRIVYLSTLSQSSFSRC